MALSNLSNRLVRDLAGRSRPDLEGQLGEQWRRCRRGWGHLLPNIRKLLHEYRHALFRAAGGDIVYETLLRVVYRHRHFGNTKGPRGVFYDLEVVVSGRQVMQDMFRKKYPACMHRARSV